MLEPIVSEGLNILFVGLNPANKSYDKGHYFSKNPAFWDQLYASGLITSQVDMNNADDRVFRSTEINVYQWKYGITDLVNKLAESNSKIVKPTKEDYEELIKTIEKNKPGIVVILHKKVIKCLVKHNKYLNGISIMHGNLGKIIDGCESIFFYVPFPHGNSITSKEKIELYKQIKTTLETLSR